MSHHIVKYCLAFLMNFSACFQVTQHTLLYCTYNLEGLHAIIKTPKNYLNITASLKLARYSHATQSEGNFRVLIRMYAFTSRVSTDPRHSSISVASIRRSDSETCRRMSSLSCLPLKLSHRNRSDPRSNLHALDTGISSHH